MKTRNMKIQVEVCTVNQLLRDTWNCLSSTASLRTANPSIQILVLDPLYNYNTILPSGSTNYAPRLISNSS